MLITYYHGTSAHLADTVMNNPELRNSINGLGFYMARDVEIARTFGTTVVAFDIEIEHCDNIVARQISAIDRNEGIEHVITNQQDLVNFIVNLDDAYIL